MPKSIGQRLDARAQLASASTLVITIFLPNFPSMRLMGSVYQRPRSRSNSDIEVVAGRCNFVLPHRRAAHREAVAGGHVEFPLVPGADDREAFQSPLAERAALVTALVGDHVEDPVDVEDGDLRAAEVGDDRLPQLDFDLFRQIDPHGDRLRDRARPGPRILFDLPLHGALELLRLGLPLLGRPGRRTRTLLARRGRLRESIGGRSGRCGTLFRGSGGGGRFRCRRRGRGGRRRSRLRGVATAAAGDRGGRPHHFLELDDEAVAAVGRLQRHLAEEQVLVDHDADALLRLEPRAPLGHHVARVRIGRVFVAQAAEQLAAAAGDLRRIGRVLLDLGHIHRDAAELLEVPAAAQGQAAVARVADQPRLVARADLLELDPGAELVGQLAHQLAEVDPRLAREVEDQALAAVDVVHVGHLHLQRQLLHDLAAHLDRAGDAFLVEAFDVDQVFRVRAADDVPEALGGDRLGDRLQRGQHFAQFLAAVGAHDAAVAHVEVLAVRLEAGDHPHLAVADAGVVGHLVLDGEFEMPAGLRAGRFHFLRELTHFFFHLDQDIGVLHAAQRLALLEDVPLPALARRADIGLRRLARPVHGAGQDADAHGDLQVADLVLQPGHQRLVRHGGAAAERTGDDLRLAHPASRRLQDVEARVDFQRLVARQGHSDRVAQPLEQDPADADRALDRPVAREARLGDADVQRDVGRLPEAEIRIDHGLHRRRLQRDDDVPEAALLQPFAVTDTALIDRVGRRVAVLVEQVLLHGAGVDADPHADAGVLGRLGHFLLAALGLVVEDRRLPADVAGVEADLVDALLDRFQRELVVEVDIADEGDLRRQELLDGADALGIALVETRDADDFAARVEHAADFLLGRLGVLGGRRGQRLDPDRVVAADDELPAGNFAGLMARDHPSSSLPTLIDRQNSAPASPGTKEG